MSVPVVCECGNEFQLKDEFAGRLVECPECGASVRAGEAPQYGADVHPAFQRDKFLLRQKLLSVKSRYYVWDENGKPIIYMERPAHLLRNLGALLGAAVALFGLMTILVFALSAILPKDVSESVVVVLMLVSFVVSFGAAALVGVFLSKKRHLSIYTDDSKSEPLLGIVQDKKMMFLRATYTVVSVDGTVLALLYKNYIYSLFRKQWRCLRPDGSLWCVAKEDSIILALLRRILGPLLGLLRVNFVIQDPETGRTIGEFNRKLTLRDRYVLDLSDDPNYTLDRRVALALGVILDTGERR